MAPTSRMDRLISILGGEDKLPVKKIPVMEATQSKATTSQPEPEEIAEVPEENKWWRTLPVLVHSSSETATSRDAASDGLNDEANISSNEVHPTLNKGNFCPFLAVTKFCYMFVSSQWKQPLASAFFDAGKIFERKWEIHYIWSSHYITPRPITFVPEEQAFQLLNEINNFFPAAQVSISKKLRADGFVLNFEELHDPNLAPKYLGLCTSKLQYEQLIDQVPPPTPTSDAVMEERSLEAFKNMMETATRISKAKRDAEKRRNHENALEKRKTIVQDLIFAQKSLGLLPAEETPQADIPAIDVNQPPSYLAHIHEVKGLVFMSIDIEAHEFNSKQITEIGIAVLRLEDVENVAPGPLGANWQKLVYGRHLRIHEYRYHVNKKYVSGCPDKFEFGESEFVSKNAIHKALASIFRYPLAESHSHSESMQTQHPPIVLVGHAIDNDLEYLREIGFDLTNKQNIVSTLDTSKLYQALVRDPNARSLGGILYDFEMAAFNLHNAGNDAVYTLWALLGIVVRSAAERGTPTEKERLDSAMEKRRDKAMQSAIQSTEEAADGWDFPGQA